MQGFISVAFWNRFGSKIGGKARGKRDLGGQTAFFPGFQLNSSGDEMQRIQSRYRGGPGIFRLNHLRENSS